MLEIKTFYCNSKSLPHYTILATLLTFGWKSVRMEVGSRGSRFAKEVERRFQRLRSEGQSGANAPLRPSERRMVFFDSNDTVRFVTITFY